MWYRNESGWGWAGRPEPSAPSWGLVLLMATQPWEPHVPSEYQFLCPIVVGQEALSCLGSLVTVGSICKPSCLSEKFSPSEVCPCPHQQPLLPAPVLPCCTPRFYLFYKGFPQASSQVKESPLPQNHLIPSLRYLHISNLKMKVISLLLSQAPC